MTLKPASEKTFAEIVPDDEDQQVIYNEVSRILGASPVENSPEATVVASTPSNKG